MGRAATNHGTVTLLDSTVSGELRRRHRQRRHSHAREQHVSENGPETVPLFGFLDTDSRNRDSLEVVFVASPPVVAIQEMKLRVAECSRTPG